MSCCISVALIPSFKNIPPTLVVVQAYGFFTTSPEKIWRENSGCIRIMVISFELVISNWRKNKSLHCFSVLDSAYRWCCSKFQYFNWIGFVTGISKWGERSTDWGFSLSKFIVIVLHPALLHPLHHWVSAALLGLHTWRSSRLLRERWEKEDKLFCPKMPFMLGSNHTHVCLCGLFSRSSVQARISFTWSFVRPEFLLIRKRLKVSEPC